jgi:hypothetical protein
VPAGVTHAFILSTDRLTLVVGAVLAAVDAPELCAYSRHILVASGAGLMVCDLGALARSDAGTIDALARLRLTARRLDRRFRVDDAPMDLRDLLIFCGLTALVGSGVEPRRQAEQRKHPRSVEEEGDPADPVA